MRTARDVRHDTGMTRCRKRAALAFETRTIVFPALAENLERDFAALVRVPRVVDDAHSSFPDDFTEFEASAENVPGPGSETRARRLATARSSNMLMGPRRGR